MQDEIRSQIEDLPRFAAQLRKSQDKIIEPSKLAFAGSGDSYAAALFAHELSKGKALAVDPYELSRAIERVLGKTLVIISVSGKTRTNLELAKRAKRVARERIAITANESSPLAKECDRVVLLDYRRSGTFTSGTVSFTCALLACAAILRKVPRSINLRGTFQQSLEWARTSRLSERGGVVFIGSGVNYSIGLYGAAKLNEVIGMRAEADYPEQFGHAHLFSVDKEHDTILCINSARDKTWELEKTLRRRGFQAKHLEVRGSDEVVNCVKIALHLQLLALTEAQRKRMKECAFKTDRARLRLSSALIY